MMIMAMMMVMRLMKVQASSIWIADVASKHRSIETVRFQ